MRTLFGLFLLLASQASAISNGELATDSRYAAIVRINLCTGFFVHPRLLITAAHCIAENSDSTIEVRKNSRSESPLRLRVERAVAHPEYSDQVFNFDIGYILLQEPVDDPEILANVLKIGEVQGPNLTAVGIGKSRSSSSPFARQSEEYKKRARLELTETRSTLLTMKAAQPGSTTCQGDSGGALLDEERKLVVGIITADNAIHPCGHPEFIMYGERLSSWREWLTQETGIAL